MTYYISALGFFLTCMREAIYFKIDSINVLSSMIYKYILKIFPVYDLCIHNRMKLHIEYILNIFYAYTSCICNRMKPYNNYTFNEFQSMILHNALDWIKLFNEYRPMILYNLNKFNEPRYNLMTY